MEKSWIAQAEVMKIEVENLLSSLQRCAPSFETMTTLTFRPTGCMDKEWAQWCSRTIDQNLIRTMQEVYEHAMAGHVREITACDRQISSKSDAETERLRNEGHRLISSYHPPKFERTLEKYTALVHAGETPAHFLVVYALRGAAFHIPFPMVVKSYVFLEALLGARTQGARQPEVLLERFLQVAGTAASKDLRAA